MERPKQIIGIDLLRLLAATLVMLYHFGFWHWIARPSLLVQLFPDRTAPPWGVWHFGWVGVEIFFVLSGLVITQSAQGVNPRRFVASRFLRLAPGAWICATASLFIMGLVLHQASTILMLKYLATLAFYPFDAVDAVYWTLGMEIAFYTLVYYLIRLHLLHSLERLMILIGLLSGVFWIAALGLAHGLEGSTGTLGVLRFLVLKAQGNRVLQLLLVQHGCLFALGVVLQRASVSGFTPRRLAALCALTLACLLEIIGQNSIIVRLAGQSLSPVPAMLCWLAAVAVLVASLAYNDAALRLLGRFGQVVRFGGRMTYPLYLVHNSVVFACVALLAPYLGFSSIAAGMLAAFLCAGLIEMYPERALRRYLATRLPGAAALPARSLGPQQAFGPQPRIKDAGGSGLPVPEL